jgi:hypothetical protein
MWRRREVTQALKSQLKDEQAELTAVEGKILAVLEAAGLERFDAPSCTVTSVGKLSVKVPKDHESREQFFSYLKQRGVFDDLITVNSQTLNAFYRQEAEIADNHGVLEFRIPGITEVTEYRDLHVRRKG